MKLLTDTAAEPGTSVPSGCLLMMMIRVDFSDPVSNCQNDCEKLQHFVTVCL